MGTILNAQGELRVDAWVARVCIFIGNRQLARVRPLCKRSDVVRQDLAVCNIGDELQVVRRNFKTQQRCVETV